MLDARVRAVLARLEAEDVAERAAKLPLAEQSLAIFPPTGALLYQLVARRPRCSVLEIGGSRGYSTIWLAAAARSVDGRVTSLEADPARATRARANLAEAGLSDVVDLREGDATDTLAELEGGFEFVFLDAWKDDYERHFRALRPLLPPGGLLVADNVLSHASTLAAYSAARQSDPDLLSVTVPLDSGLEITYVLTDGLHS